MRFRLVSASQSYGGGGASASCGLTMSYDDLWRITGKSQHVSQTGLIRPGARKLLWDGDNRLRALSDDGYMSLCWYDADGNRTVKERHGGEAVWVNSARAGQRTDSVVYSIYPSPYINVNGDHWTKHYYIGDERVASMTGTLSGGFGSLDFPGNVVASPGPWRLHPKW